MRYLLIGVTAGLLTVAMLASCNGKKEKVLTPWGEEVGSEDSLPKQGGFTLTDIQSNGELIVLTMSGPETTRLFWRSIVTTMMRIPSCES